MYWSLETIEIQHHTPKLYYLSSISKKFRTTEILCPYRADLTTPFPFSQDDLYQANQPGNDTLDVHALSFIVSHQTFSHQKNIL